MNLRNFIIFLGSLAFISAIITVFIFVINYKYKDFFKNFSKGKFNHIKLHKFFGITTILLGTIHGLSMIFNYPLILKTYTSISGILLLILFWILGFLPFLVKKVPPKYKKIFFKSHKILGSFIFIFIFIHIWI